MTLQNFLSERTNNNGDRFIVNKTQVNMPTSHPGIFVYLGYRDRFSHEAHQLVGLGEMLCCSSHQLLENNFPPDSYQVLNSWYTEQLVSALGFNLFH